MREFRTYGSVRGAVGNDRPYREPGAVANVAAASGGLIIDRFFLIFDGFRIPIGS